MKDTMAMILFMIGLVLTMGGVGGMETSMDLLPGFLCAVVGLGIMYCGVLAIKVNEGRYYG